MKSIISLLLVAAAGFGIAESATALDSESAELKSFLYTHTLKPCTIWSPAPNSSGYVCTFYDFGVRVPDADSLVDVINDLERQIGMLEQRIQQLESRP
jgi:hypothetical protein